MSWWLILHLVITAVIFVMVFVEGDDEPAFLRLFTAALLALLWLPMLVLGIAFVAFDYVSARLKRWFGK